jgi:hypothetical protein
VHGVRDTDDAAWRILQLAAQMGVEHSASFGDVGNLDVELACEQVREPRFVGWLEVGVVAVKAARVLRNADGSAQDTG